MQTDAQVNSKANNSSKLKAQCKQLCKFVLKNHSNFSQDLVRLLWQFTVTLVRSARSVKDVDDDLYNKDSIQEEDGDIRWKITQHKKNKGADS